MNHNLVKGGRRLYPPSKSYGFNGLAPISRTIYSLYSAYHTNFSRKALQHVYCSHLPRSVHSSANTSDGASQTPRSLRRRDVKSSERVEHENEEARCNRSATVAISANINEFLHNLEDRYRLSPYGSEEANEYTMIALSRFLSILPDCLSAPLEDDTQRELVAIIKMLTTATSHLPEHQLPSAFATLTHIATELSKLEEHLFLARERLARAQAQRDEEALQDELIRVEHQRHRRQIRCLGFIRALSARKAAKKATLEAAYIKSLSRPKTSSPSTSPPEGVLPPGPTCAPALSTIDLLSSQWAIKRRRALRRVTDLDTLVLASRAASAEMRDVLWTPVHDRLVPMYDLRTATRRRNKVSEQPATLSVERRVACGDGGAGALGVDLEDSTAEVLLSDEDTGTTRSQAVEMAGVEDMDVVEGVEVDKRSRVTAGITNADADLPVGTREDGPAAGAGDGTTAGMAVGALGRASGGAGVHNSDCVDPGISELGDVDAYLREDGGEDMGAYAGYVGKTVSIPSIRSRWHGVRIAQMRQMLLLEKAMVGMLTRPEHRDILERRNARNSSEGTDGKRTGVGSKAARGKGKHATGKAVKCSGVKAKEVAGNLATSKPVRSKPVVASKTAQEKQVESEGGVAPTNSAATSTFSSTTAPATPSIAAAPAPTASTAATPRTSAATPTTYGSKKASKAVSSARKTRSSASAILTTVKAVFSTFARRSALPPEHDASHTSSPQSRPSRTQSPAAAASAVDTIGSSTSTPHQASSLPANSPPSPPVSVDTSPERMDLLQQAWQWLQPLRTLTARYNARSLYTNTSTNANSSRGSHFSFAPRTYTRPPAASPPLATTISDETYTHLLATAHDPVLTLASELLSVIRGNVSLRARLEGVATGVMVRAATAAPLAPSANTTTTNTTTTNITSTTTATTTSTTIGAATPNAISVTTAAATNCVSTSTSACAATSASTTIARSPDSTAAAVTDALMSSWLELYNALYAHWTSENASTYLESGKKSDGLGISGGVSLPRDKSGSVSAEASTHATTSAHTLASNHRPAKTDASIHTYTDMNGYMHTNPSAEAELPAWLTWGLWLSAYHSCLPVAELTTLLGDMQHPNADTTTTSPQSENNSADETSRRLTSEETPSGISTAAREHSRSGKFSHGSGINDHISRIFEYSPTHSSSNPPSCCLLSVPQRPLAPTELAVALAALQPLVLSCARHGTPHTRTDTDGEETTVATSNPSTSSPASTLSPPELHPSLLAYYEAALRSSAERTHTHAEAKTKADATVEAEVGTGTRAKVPAKANTKSVSGSHTRTRRLSSCSLPSLYSSLCLPTIAAARSHFLPLPLPTPLANMLTSLHTHIPALPRVPSLSAPLLPSASTSTSATASPPASPALAPSLPPVDCLLHSLHCLSLALTVLMRVHQTRTDALQTALDEYLRETTTVPPCPTSTSSLSFSSSSPATSSATDLSIWPAYTTTPISDTHALALLLPVPTPHELMRRAASAYARAHTHTQTHAQACIHTRVGSSTTAHFPSLSTTSSPPSCSPLHSPLAALADASPFSPLERAAQAQLAEIAAEMAVAKATLLADEVPCLRDPGPRAAMSTYKGEGASGNDTETASTSSTALAHVFSLSRLSPALLALLSLAPLTGAGAHVEAVTSLFTSPTTVTVNARLPVRVAVAGGEVVGISSACAAESVNAVADAVDAVTEVPLTVSVTVPVVEVFPTRTCTRTPHIAHNAHPSTSTSVSASTSPPGPLVLPLANLPQLQLLRHALSHTNSTSISATADVSDSTTKATSAHSRPSSTSPASAFGPSSPSLASRPSTSAPACAPVPASPLALLMQLNGAHIHNHAYGTYGAHQHPDVISLHTSPSAVAPSSAFAPTHGWQPGPSPPSASCPQYMWLTSSLAIQCSPVLAAPCPSPLRPPSLATATAASTGAMAKYHHASTPYASHSSSSPHSKPSSSSCTSACTPASAAILDALVDSITATDYLASPLPPSLHLHMRYPRVKLASPTKHAHVLPHCPPSSPSPSSALAAAFHLARIHALAHTDTPLNLLSLATDIPTLRVLPQPSWASAHAYGAWMCVLRDSIKRITSLADQIQAQAQVQGPVRGTTQVQGASGTSCAAQPEQEAACAGAVAPDILGVMPESALSAPAPDPAAVAAPGFLPPATDMQARMAAEGQRAVVWAVLQREREWLWQHAPIHAANATTNTSNTSSSSGSCPPASPLPLAYLTAAAAIRTLTLARGHRSSVWLARAPQPTHLSTAASASDSMGLHDTRPWVLPSWALELTHDDNSLLDGDSLSRNVDNIEVDSCVYPTDPLFDGGQYNAHTQARTSTSSSTSVSTSASAREASRALHSLVSYSRLCALTDSIVARGVVTAADILISLAHTPPQTSSIAPTTQKAAEDTTGSPRTSALSTAPPTPPMSVFTPSLFSLLLSCCDAHGLTALARETLHLAAEHGYATASHAEQLVSLAASHVHLANTADSSARALWAWWRDGVEMYWRAEGHKAGERAGYLQVMEAAAEAMDAKINATTALKAPASHTHATHMAASRASTSDMPLLGSESDVSMAPTVSLPLRLPLACLPTPRPPPPPILAAPLLSQWLLAWRAMLVAGWGLVSVVGDATVQGDRFHHLRHHHRNKAPLPISTPQYEAGAGKGRGSRGGPSWTPQLETHLRQLGVGGPTPFGSSAILERDRSGRVVSYRKTTPSSQGLSSAIPCIFSPTARPDTWVAPNTYTYIEAWGASLALGRAAAMDKLSGGPEGWHEEQSQDSVIPTAVSHFAAAPASVATAHTPTSAFVKHAAARPPPSATLTHGTVTPPTHNTHSTVSSSSSGDSTLPAASSASASLRPSSPLLTSVLHAIFTSGKLVFATHNELPVSASSAFLFMMWLALRDADAMWKLARMTGTSTPHSVHQRHSTTSAVSTLSSSTTSTPRASAVALPALTHAPTPLLASAQAIAAVYGYHIDVDPNGNTAPVLVYVGDTDTSTSASTSASILASAAAEVAAAPHTDLDTHSMSTSAHTSTNTAIVATTKLPPVPSTLSLFIKNNRSRLPSCFASVPVDAITDAALRPPSPRVSVFNSSLLALARSTAAFELSTVPLPVVYPSPPKPRAPSHNPPFTSSSPASSISAVSTTRTHTHPSDRASAADTVAMAANGIQAHAAAKPQAPEHARAATNNQDTATQGNSRHGRRLQGLSRREALHVAQTQRKALLARLNGNAPADTDAAIGDASAGSARGNAMGSAANRGSPHSEAAGIPPGAARAPSSAVATSPVDVMVLQRLAMSPRSVHNHLRDAATARVPSRSIARGAGSGLVNDEVNPSIESEALNKVVSYNSSAPHATFADFSTPIAVRAAHLHTDTADLSVDSWCDVSPTVCADASSSCHTPRTSLQPVLALLHTIATDVETPLRALAARTVESITTEEYYFRECEAFAPSASLVAGATGILTREGAVLTSTDENTRSHATVDAPIAPVAVGNVTPMAVTNVSEQEGENMSAPPVAVDQRDALVSAAAAGDADALAYWCMRNLNVPKNAELTLAQRPLATVQHTIAHFADLVRHLNITVADSPVTALPHVPHDALVSLIDVWPARPKVELAIAAAAADCFSRRAEALSQVEHAMMQMAMARESAAAGGTAAARRHRRGDTPSSHVASNLHTVWDAQPLSLCPACATPDRYSAPSFGHNTPALDGADSPSRHLPCARHSALTPARTMWLRASASTSQAHAVLAAHAAMKMATTVIPVDMGQEQRDARPTHASGDTAVCRPWKDSLTGANPAAITSTTPDSLISSSSGTITINTPPWEATMVLHSHAQTLLQELQLASGIARACAGNTTDGTLLATFAMQWVRACADAAAVAVQAVQMEQRRINAARQAMETPRSFTLPSASIAALRATSIDKKGTVNAVFSAIGVEDDLDFHQLLKDNAASILMDSSNDIASSTDLVIPTMDVPPLPSIDAILAIVPTLAQEIAAQSHARVALARMLPPLPKRSPTASDDDTDGGVHASSRPFVFTSSFRSGGALSASVATGKPPGASAASGIRPPHVRRPTAAKPASGSKNGSASVAVDSLTAEGLLVGAVSKTLAELCAGKVDAVESIIKHWRSQKHQNM